MINIRILTALSLLPHVGLEQLWVQLQVITASVIIYYMTFKFIKSKAPEYMAEMFSTKTYQLRHNHQKLYVPKPKTNFSKRSFPYRGAVLWNQVIAEKYLKRLSVLLRS